MVDFFFYNHWIYTQRKLWRMDKEIWLLLLFYTATNVQIYCVTIFDYLCQNKQWTLSVSKIICCFRVKIFLEQPSHCFSWDHTSSFPCFVTESEPGCCWDNKVCVYLSFPHRKQRNKLPEVSRSGVWWCRWHGWRTGFATMQVLSMQDTAEFT